MLDLNQAQSDTSKEIEKLLNKLNCNELPESYKEENKL